MHFLMMGGPPLEITGAMEAQDELLTVTGPCFVACVVTPSTWPSQAPYVAMATPKYSREMKPLAKPMIAGGVSIPGIWKTTKGVWLNRLQTTSILTTCIHVS